MHIKDDPSNSVINLCKFADFEVRQKVLQIYLILQKHIFIPPI